MTADTEHRLHPRTKVSIVSQVLFQFLAILDPKMLCGLEYGGWTICSAQAREYGETLTGNLTAAKVDLSLSCLWERRTHSHVKLRLLLLFHLIQYFSNQPILIILNTGDPRIGMPNLWIEQLIPHGGCLSIDSHFSLSPLSEFMS